MNEEITRQAAYVDELYVQRRIIDLPPLFLDQSKCRREHPTLKVPFNEWAVMELSVGLHRAGTWRELPLAYRYGVFRGCCMLEAGTEIQYLTYSAYTVNTRYSTTSRLETRRLWVRSE